MYCTVDQINFENITLVNPKKKNDKYISYLFHERDPIVIKSSKYIYQGCKDDILSVKNDETKSFTLFLSSFEHFLAEQIHLKSEKWFNGKKFSIDHIIEKFDSCIKDKSLDFQTTHKTTVYNNNNKEKTIKNIRKGDIVIFLLHIKGIWVSKDQIGLLTNVNQIKFFAKPTLKVEKISECVIDESDSESSYSCEEDSDTEEALETINEENLVTDINDLKISDSEEVKTEDIEEELVEEVKTEDIEEELVEEVKTEDIEEELVEEVKTEDIEEDFKFF